MRVGCLVVLVSACTGNSTTALPPPTAATPHGAPSIPATTPAAVAPVPKPSAKDQLIALGKRKLAELTKANPESPDTAGLIPALGTCVRPTDEQRATLLTTASAWITQAEPRYAVGVPTMTVGCVEKTGIVVDLQADLTPRGTKPSGGKGATGFWWTLRIDGAKLTTLDRVTGPALESWMEWVQERSLSTVVLADLDKDGLLDVVSARVSHEGGSMLENYDVSVFPTAKPGKLSQGESSSVAIRPTRPQPVLAAGTVVLALEGKESHDATCVTAARGWSRCPAVADVLKTEAAIQAATYLSSLEDRNMQDRDALVESLDGLEVPAAEQAAILPPAPTPSEK